LTICGDRSDVDDDAAAGLDHVATEGLAAAPESVEVDVDHLIPLIVGDLERGAMDARARVVDENVDAPVPLDDRGERPPHVVGVAHVEMHGVHAVADPGGRLSRAVIVPRRDHDGRPDVHEALDPRLAQPAIAAGHDGDLATEIEAVEYGHAVSCFGMIMTLTAVESSRPARSAASASSRP
jgi:hypothetical protein